jgi:hypothetical protein
MDMLNSGWPIGPVGVGTLAVPEKVDAVKTTMERMWHPRDSAPARLQWVWR